MPEAVKNVWLDCDPGHDDATAILLAVNIAGIRLLGISTVHGNADATCTFNNAIRCLHAYGASSDIHVCPGATKPLIRPAKHDPEIHGADGLGGVESLPSIEHPDVQTRLKGNGTLRAIEGISRVISQTWKEGKGEKVYVVSTGPMTNIALFVSVYPELLNGVQEFVFMGGGVGLGNRSAAAEYNILCDPHAAQIVLNAPVKKTMIPINVTHTAIVSKDVIQRLLSPTLPNKGVSVVDAREAATPLRDMLFTLVGFFAASYESVFGFKDGPPLHDALTLAYVAHPEIFKCKRYRVDVELTAEHTVGETVVDMWDYRQANDTWGPAGKNCIVAESVDVPAFFDIFLDSVRRCDSISPLNLPKT